MAGRVASFFRMVSALLRRSTTSASAPDGGSAEFGRWGEDVAVDSLARKGYKILGRRVRPNRHDEIDIVARDGDTIAFVEVKTRRSEAFGRPADAVRHEKRHALNRAARAYLRRLGFPKCFCRFDVVEVVAKPGEAASAVRHLENAFPFEPSRRIPGRTTHSSNRHP